MPITETCDLLTHSRMACMRTCAWKHYLEYEVGIRPDRESAPLRIGKALHLGLDLMAQGKPLIPLVEQYSQAPPWAQDADSAQAWTVEGIKVLALLSGYAAHWQGSVFEFVATEQVFILPIRNPATGRMRRKWKVAGKMDKIIQLPDLRIALEEHKSTSDKIDDDSDYWDKLRLDQQISLYFWAASQLGYDVQTIVYDVIRKLGLQLKKATPPEKRKYKKDGILYASQRDVDQRTDEYADELASDIAKQPETYYARKEVARLDDDMQRCIAEMDQMQQIITFCRKNNAWPRNTAACLVPYRCQYYGLCSMGINPVQILHNTGRPSDGFKVVDNIHPELEEHDEPDPSTTESAATPAGNEGACAKAP